MLIWSRAAPDELALGHQERLAVLNGVTSRARLTKAIERWRIERGGEALSATGFLGLVTAWGEDIRDYARNHAWLPNDHVFIRKPGSKSPLERNAFPPDLRSVAPHHWKARFFCWKCASEDRERYRFSYWRRFHQFSGVVHCDRHSVGLSFVAHGKGPSLPQHHEGHARQVDARLVDSVADHPVVSRYYELARCLLAFESRIRLSSAYTTLFSRSRELGLFEIGEHWCTGLQRKILSDLPRDWLEACFVGDLHRTKVTNSYSSPLTSSDWTLTNLKEYTLALAVLYATADDALHFLHAKR